MHLIFDLKIWFFLLWMINPIIGYAFNQPKFCSNATWKPNATTFAGGDTVGCGSNVVVIDKNNTVYLTISGNNRLQIWFDGNTNSAKNFSSGLSGPQGLFIRENGDIFIDNGANGRVEKWTLTATSGVSVMTVSSKCFSLFVDNNNTLYCMQQSPRSVVKRSLNSSSLSSTAVTGATGFSNAHGIFVDHNFNLYIADYATNQIKRVTAGASSATTVVGSSASAPRNFALNGPIAVMLDGNEYFFILEYNGNRLIGESSTGFRCIVGCSGSGGGAPYQLSGPYSFSFDINGNIFIVDQVVCRFQKFLIDTNSCVEATTSLIPTSTMETTTANVLQMNSSEIYHSTEQLSTSFIHTTGTESITSLLSTTLIPHSTLTATITNQTCFSPIVILIPNSPSPTNPLQFRKSQDFYITSHIELNCNDSLSIISQWTIYNCTTTMNCSFPLQIDSIIQTTFTELYIPARILPYGFYRFQLTITMSKYPTLTKSSSTYVWITVTGIVTNLVQYGTSMITRGHLQDLTLNPGSFSVDLDDNTFNSTDWIYQYYCRIYILYNFPHINGYPLTIDDLNIDPSNPSCLSNRTDNQKAWKYENVFNSSLTIRNGSLLSNRTYQFMVKITNARNASRQATGYLLVRVNDNPSEIIIIGCVISIMCNPNQEFHLVNPTTQVALFSSCFQQCPTIQNITWKIYYSSNSSNSSIQWILFNQTNQYENSWFFGINTINFTASNQLFIQNPSFLYWRFEVIYSFLSESSSSALNFIINQPPKNGSCSIFPLNGTILTVFNILCINWFDFDDIKDYSLYMLNSNTDRQLIAFSSISKFQVRLPTSNQNTSILHLVIYIRDTLDCVTQYNLSLVHIIPDSSILTDNKASNSILQLLASGNQNTVGQILTSVSQQINQNNTQSITNAVSNGISPSTISITSFGSQMSSETSISSNESALIEYEKQLNTHATIREYLMNFTINLAIINSNSIILQASSLVQLTAATNQLTRSAATIASDRCHQLAKSLNLIATKISFEDIQIAANQISQCVSNIQTAMNSPLQKRTTILDLDNSRANAFPKDYDTDLENEWSNPYLFADGNDFSWTTIQKGRNLYCQQQLANQINEQSATTIALLTSALNIHLNIGQNLIFNTSSVFLSLETISIDSLTNKIIQPMKDTHIQLPANLQSNFNRNQTFSLQTMIQTLAQSDDFRSKANTNLSRSISLSISDRNGNPLSISTNLSNPYRFLIPRDPNIFIPSMTKQNLTSFNNTPHQLIFNLHHIDLQQSEYLSISVHIQIKPLNFSNNIPGYLLIYRFDQIPQLNTTIQLIDGWSLLCPSNFSIIDDFYQYSIDNQQTIGHQSLVFGIRELNTIELIHYCSNQTLPISNQPFNFTFDYSLRVYTSGCYYFNEQLKQWQSDGLLVGSMTNLYQTECLSTHLTTFAGGFLVLPAPINWNYVFSNADFSKNKTIYLTVICISILYLIFIIYARYKDRKDFEKLGVMFLDDNYIEDQYYYEIIVVTGHRRFAGTNSNVQFILSGNNDDTKVRKFSNSKRKIFQRAGIDAFVMNVPKSLGSLNYIRLWHDNSGQGSSSSWFLKYIIVRDLQTLEKSYFICQKWFALEKDDGRIERILPIASDYEKQQFSYVLSKRAYHSMSEGHLWFSIFTRPPSNHFTRVQRCTCCFVLLFVSMLLNILYYDQMQQAKSISTNQTSLSLGSLYITPEQISIGVIVELLAFVPSLLLVQFFRRIRLRKMKYSLKTRSQKYTLPWWCLFFAYGLSISTVIVSIFFIIIRGIEFGDLKTQQWLTSLISGFFSSILFIQPIKILSLAIIFACFIRKYDQDEEITEYINEQTSFDLTEDEEYLHSMKKRSLFSYRRDNRINRLTDDEKDAFRYQRIKQIQMWSILREIFLYLSFLSLLYAVTYSNINSHGFYQINHLKKFILNSERNNHTYHKISTIDEYWNWLQKNFIWNIRAREWYNGEQPRNLSGYINDKTNRLIGRIIIRQLRIKLQSCQIKSIISSICRYNDEEKESFLPKSNVSYSIVIRQAFEYRIDEHNEIENGYIYEFQGRLTDIQNNLSMLHQLQWIDRQTKSVIIQFSLYNPNVQLFTSITLQTDFLSIGGLIPQFQIKLFSFQIFSSLSALICSIMYMIFIIYMLIEQIQRLCRLKIKYFHEFWHYIDISIIICSWTSIGIYFWRYNESQRLGSFLQQTNGYAYINLNKAVYINEILIYLISSCCFFSTIKCIRLCRFNNRLLFFLQIFVHARKELLSFSFMFSFIFISFICLFYLLFNSNLETCSNIFETMRMLFEMILMKFDANQLIQASPILAPICFSLFIFIVVFLCLSVFLTIINENFRYVRNHAKDNEGEHMFFYIFEQFRCWLGLQSESELFEERDRIMRRQYIHSIEQFPDKIDELFIVLNRITCDNEAFI